MRDFTKTYHCICGLHCHACQNDPEWRAGMVRKFTMPAKCPYGGASKITQWRVPVEAQAICGACDGKGCPNVACVSCGGRTEINIQYPCPRGKWTMVKERQDAD